MVASLFVAFGLTATLSEAGRAWCYNDNLPEDSPTCAAIKFLLFPAISCVCQMLYDSFAQFVVTCGCVQKWTLCCKNCVEAMGKAFFYLLLFIAIVIAAGGITVLQETDTSHDDREETDTDNRVLVAIVIFTVTKLLTFTFFTSLVVWATYHHARKRQVRPS